MARTHSIWTSLLLGLTLLLSFDTLYPTSALAKSSASTPRALKPEEAHHETHRIWSSLRDAEPTWRESLIDTKPTSLAVTVWQYLKMIFRTLFMNTPTHLTPTDASTSLPPHLQTAVSGLTHASTTSNDALFLLAEMNFFGNFSHPRNFSTAFAHYLSLAESSGNATAQHMLGLMYSTGLSPSVPIDQSKAQMYYTFAAEQGHTRAEMTMAHRFYMGIGTPKTCDAAVRYYKRVADKAMDWWLSGPPGGHLVQRKSYRWVEDAGGSYGEGASWSSSGVFAADRNAVYYDFDDMLEFLDMREKQGDWNATLTLGRHFYEPPRGYRRNLAKARKQFLKITSTYWTRDGKVNSRAPRGMEGVAAKAAAYIGRMYLRGEGNAQDLEKALVWLNRAKSASDPFGLYHLGIMYRDGLGVKKNGQLAAEFLKIAAEQQLGIAMSALGVLFLDQGDIETAARYFERARNANVMEGYYYLAELANSGVGMQKNCHYAATYYKIVAEKAESLHSAFVEANSAYERGDMERALIASLLAAEQGYENGQANVAYLLDQKTSILTLPETLPFFNNPLEPVPDSRRTSLLHNPKLAQIYFTRSSQQSNIDSLLKAGDYHMTSASTPSLAFLRPTSNTTTSSHAHLEAMHACYSVASEASNSAQALWNMGWMYENGLSSLSASGDSRVEIVKQDFHMAKRYYDLAYEMNKEAYLPVKLALLKLRLRSWWNGVSGGKVKGIDEEDPDEKKKAPKGFMDWLERFIEAGNEMDAEEWETLQRDGRDGVGEGELSLREDGDGLEALSRADDRGETGARREGDDDFYYGQRLYGADRDRELDEEYYADLDDGLLESLIIVALAGALAMLVYLRQQRQRDQRQAQGQGQAQAGNAAAAGRPRVGQAHAQPQQNQNLGQGDRGLFPNPGDPEYQNWVAGGIGH